MRQPLSVCLLFALATLTCSCKKQGVTQAAADAIASFTVDGNYNGTLAYANLGAKPSIKFSFTEAIATPGTEAAIKLTSAAGIAIPLTISFADQNKTLTVIPQSDLSSLSAYTLTLSASVTTPSGGRLVNPLTISLSTGLTGEDKFPRISDDELLTKVQRQTFAYFWDFGHPLSGLARERNTSGDVVTSGGSGFGVMAVLVGIERGFITRAEGLARVKKMVAFLKTADTFHGAFPHWLDGASGKVIPFSTKDNGGDLVETSYLMQGLLAARQYFSGVDASESALRADINTLYSAVEWSWYRKDNGSTLYWHWSPSYTWEMNLPVKGWNECLITYVLAASSPTYAISKAVYDSGWANGGSMKNGNTYYGYVLPLGSANGGPLFFAHYSFLGLNPTGLVDGYANYETQTKNHTLINRAYCVANPKSYYGYSADCWGLTASDIQGGYAASSPANDLGVIAPTASLSSFPYTPVESMQALKFFYYKLGDKLWGPYGFYDSFNLKDRWFASSTLAIDQGPIIVMIENYRSKLLWNLVMSCPEIKNGMKNLGFSGPNL